MNNLEKIKGELLEKNIGHGRTVLHLGCGEGSLTASFSIGNQILGIDIDENLLKKANENLHIKTLLMDINGDWSELGNENFDIVVISDMLNRLYFLDEVIKRILGHLRAGGLFLGFVSDKKKMGRKELKDILDKHFKKVTVTGLSWLSPVFFFRAE